VLNFPHWKVGPPSLVLEMLVFRWFLSQDVPEHDRPHGLGGDLRKRYGLQERQ
jgi:hypothetical protein